jgi:hypothetical protein
LPGQPDENDPNGIGEEQNPNNINMEDVQNDGDLPNFNPNPLG